MSDKFFARVAIALWCLAFFPGVFGLLGDSDQHRLAQKVGSLLTTLGGIASINPVYSVAKEDDRG